MPKKNVISITDMTQKAYDYLLQENYAKKTYQQYWYCGVIPIRMITEVLGQSNTDSTRPYIAVHRPGLAECALDLQSIPLGREELR